MKMNKEVFNKLVEEANCSCLCGVNTHMLERFAEAVCKWQNDLDIVRIRSIMIDNSWDEMMARQDRDYNSALEEAIEVVRNDSPFMITNLTRDN